MPTPKKKILTFAEILRMAEIYSKIHHKYLHYGEIVSFITLYPKKCIYCGATVYKGKHICAKCERSGE
jgi:hypothetical protein